MVKVGWHIIHRFDGEHDWEELNRLIRFDSGCDLPFFETEEDYKNAVADGFVQFNGFETTIWCDGIYEEV